MTSLVKLCSVVLKKNIKMKKVNGRMTDGRKDDERNVMAKAHPDF
jgi:hypothetical protein